MMQLTKIAYSLPIRTVRSLPHFSIVNEGLARRTVSQIDTANSTVILPYSDYPNVFTETLINSNYRKLVICEPTMPARNLLKEHIRANHPGRNTIVIEHDILARAPKLECDESQDIIRTSMSGCDYEKDWRILTTNKFIIPLLKAKQESSLFTSLVYQIAYKKGLYMNGRVEFYMFLSGRQCNYFRAKPSKDFHYYRSNTILCNSLFDLEYLDRFNLKEGFNINLKKIMATKLSSSSPRMDIYNEVHLVKVTPKPHLFEIFTPNALLEFRFLVRQCMISRRALVTPFMERWFHKCRDDMYKIGFGEPKRFGDMTCDDLLRLYAYVKARPDYNMSTLRTAASVLDNNIESLGEAQLIGC